MKITKSNYLLVLIFLAAGCSTSKESMVKESQKIVQYHVRANTTEKGIYKALIDNQFRKLENLESRFVKIHYDRNENLKYDCEIEILFDKLNINDEESTGNKSFSKKVRDEQVTEDSNNPNIVSDVTVRGYVYQRKTNRILNWDVIMRINSDSNNCELTNTSFTESFTSKYIDNTISGDERAISKKYREPVGELLSKRKMAEEAISRVYKKIESQLKESH